MARVWSASAGTAVVSDAAALHGYGHLDAGRLDLADAWFAKAVALARQAGDRPREAYALGSSALPSSLAPAPRQAERATGIAALEAAAGLQRFLSPAGRAWVFGYLAREHAALGRDLASGRFLEQGRTGAARIRPGGSGWGWWSAYGELHAIEGARFETFAGVRSVRLGRASEAIELFDGALDVTTVPVLRASWQGRVTEACVALGDPATTGRARPPTRSSTRPKRTGLGSIARRSTASA
ncbi:MAG: hypothetical protein ACRD0K_01735 [Egibacteraceae bacterium]